MKLTLNGEPRELPTDDATTVQAMLAHFGMAELRVAVELNGVIVRHAAWETTAVGDGDVVQVVQFVGGG